MKAWNHGQFLEFTLISLCIVHLRFWKRLKCTNQATKLKRRSVTIDLTVAKSHASGVNRLGTSGGKFEGDSDSDMDEDDCSAENLMINNAKTLSDLGILLVFQDETHLIVAYQIHYSRNLKIFNIDGQSVTFIIVRKIMHQNSLTKSHINRRLVKRHLTHLFLLKKHM
jgi:hypothetical protein